MLETKDAPSDIPITFPRIADTLDSWINDNFQTLTPAT